MKINGRKLSAPSVEYAIFPREDGDVVFYCKALLSHEDFEKMVPIPEPPVIRYPDNRVVKNVESDEYKEDIAKYLQMKSDWTILTSLRDTPGLEWEMVKYEDPQTWKDWKDELRTFLTEGEILYLLNTITIVNGLSESKIQRARESFLAGLASTPTE